MVVSFFEKKEGRFAPYRSLRGCARVLYLFLQVGAYSVNVVKTGVRSCVETASRVFFVCLVVSFFGFKASFLHKKDVGMHVVFLGG